MLPSIRFHCDKINHIDPNRSFFKKKCFRTRAECTSLDGILSGTIHGVIKLKKESGSNGVVIVGGTEVTEAGHPGGVHSHINGFKVDLEKSDQVLNNFIKYTFKQIADRSDGSPQFKDKHGNIYCVSLDHFLPFPQHLHLACFWFLEYRG